MMRLKQRRALNDILIERNHIFFTMLEGKTFERMQEGILFIVLLAATLRWRLETVLHRVKGRSGISIDALMVALSTITVTAGPGRKREVTGIVRGQKSILSALNCMPEHIIPGCPVPSSGVPENIESGAPRDPSSEII